MFTDFNKTFKERKDEEFKIPKAFLEMLNEKIPKDLQQDFEYEDIGNGICLMKQKNAKKIEISASIKLPDIPKEIRRQIHNTEELYKYLYNTQKACDICPDKDGNIRINNSVIQLNEIQKNFLHNGKSGMKVFKMVPSPFPLPLKIKMESEGIIREFTLKREPYESVDTIYLKSIEETPLEIHMYAKDDRSGSFRINYNIEEISEIKEIIEILKFCKGCFNGNINIKSPELGHFDTQKIDDSSIQEKIGFWEKALKVEEKIGQELDGRKIVNNDDDGKLILELYKSLVEQVPYRLKGNVNNITYEAIKEYNNIEEFKGQELDMSYKMKEEIAISNQKITIYSLTVIFNCKIEDIVKEGVKRKIILNNENEENERFVVRKLFLTEGALQEDFDNFDEQKYKLAEILEE